MVKGPPNPNYLVIDQVQLSEIIQEKSNMQINQRSIPTAVAAPPIPHSTTFSS